MPMYVASTTKTRQHAYPATVDTAAGNDTHRRLCSRCERRYNLYY